MHLFLLFLLLFSFSAFAAPKEILLTPENTVIIRGEVNESSITQLQLDLLLTSRLLDKDAIIYLVVDSPGGSVYSGLDITSTLQQLPQKVHTISIFAASMGFYIAQHGEKRYIAERGIMMGHRAKGSFDGQFETGEVESQLALWKDLVREMEQFNADKMGISLKVYKEKVINEMWLYGENAVKENGADEMIRIKCSKELLDLEMVVDSSIMTMFGPIERKTVYSACPVFRNPIREVKKETKE